MAWLLQVDALAYERGPDARPSPVRESSCPAAWPPAASGCRARPVRVITANARGADGPVASSGAQNRTMTEPSPTHHHCAGLPEGASWDERYSGKDRVWSGRPNGALVAEAAGLPPGTALDVGCGEGADAVWLAQQGWEVTALDVSRVALDRAESAAQAAGSVVRWLHSGLLDADLPPAGFDLVSAQYPALLHTAGDDAERALLTAVAPGGTLLVVHHADVDAEHARARGFDPADYVSPSDVLRHLDDGWRVEVDERRVRDIDGGEGAHHTHDLVLRATRLS